MYGQQKLGNFWAAIFVLLDLMLTTGLKTILLSFWFDPTITMNANKSVTATFIKSAP
jgi:hypothetical protein